MFVFNLELYFSLSGFSSSEENLLMSNGFSIADMGVNSHGIFEGKKILKTITCSKNYLKIRYNKTILLWAQTIFHLNFVIDEGFQTSALQSNPSVTRIPAMALPLQEGPETCSRNVNFLQSQTTSCLTHNL